MQVQPWFLIYVACMLGGALVTILLAAVAASLYPAWRASLAEAAELSRDGI